MLRATTPTWWPQHTTKPLLVSGQGVFAPALAKVMENVLAPMSIRVGDNFQIISLFLHSDSDSEFSNWVSAPESS